MPEDKFDIDEAIKSYRMAAARAQFNDRDYYFHCRTMIEGFELDKLESEIVPDKVMWLPSDKGSENA